MDPMIMICHLRIQKTRDTKVLLCHTEGQGVVVQNVFTPTDNTLTPRLMWRGTTPGCCLTSACRSPPALVWSGEWGHRRPARPSMTRTCRRRPRRGRSPSHGYTRSGQGGGQHHERCQGGNWLHASLDPGVHGCPNSGHQGSQRAAFLEALLWWSLIKT